MNANSKIKSFTDLITWQEVHKLVLSVYKITREFPKDERFGLISQLCRAVISISSNIAEGFSRGTMKDKIQFYRIAQGSVTEVQNQLLIARDIGYLDKSMFVKIADQTILVNKLINGLIRSSKSRNT